MKKIAYTLAFIAISHSANAWQPNVSELIDDSIHQEIEDILNDEIVVQSILNQNQLHKNLKQANVDELDKTWRKQTKQTSKPLIASMLNRPLSAYLTRIQAHSGGKFTETFVMDDKGLNVGQSAMTSDFWQGDEGKWQKTFKGKVGELFIDKPEFNNSRKAWVTQYNIAIVHNGKNIGAATFELNLTEIARQKNILQLVEKKENNNE